MTENGNGAARSKKKHGAWAPYSSASVRINTASHEPTALPKLACILAHKLHLHLAALGLQLRNKHAIPQAEFTSKPPPSSAYRAPQQIKIENVVFIHFFQAL